MYKYNHIKKILIGLVLVFFSGICTVAVADIHYFVQMKVNQQEDELVIKTNKGDAGGCTGSKYKGCVKANRNDDIKVSFLLAGNTKCNLENGVKWKLADVILGGYYTSGDGSKPEDDGWGGFAVDSDVDQDFTFADLATGVLKPVSAKTDRQIIIRDKNTNVYGVWYKVTADCIDASGGIVKTISVDPRVINEGKD